MKYVLLEKSNILIPGDQYINITAHIGVSTWKAIWASHIGQKVGDYPCFVFRRKITGNNRRWLHT